MEFIKKNWQRCFFVILALIFIGFSLNYLLADRLERASATFAMGFFCFLYSDIANFKRFKGLGFEIEQFEKAQKRVENLAEELKNIIKIYSHELLRAGVMEGRLMAGNDWVVRWELFKNITDQHDILRLDINLSETKIMMDQFFMLDLINPHYKTVRNALQSGASTANNSINQEFGSPIKDNAGYSARLTALRKIATELEGILNLAKTMTYATSVIELLSRSKKSFKEEFDVDIVVDSEIIKKLEELSTMETQIPFPAASELLKIAKNEQVKLSS